MVYLLIVIIIISSIALGGPWPPVFWGFHINIFFLWVGVVSLMPILQPGRPGYLFLSGSSPLTCLAWEALPLAYATASIALRIIWPHKPHHFTKVGGSFNTLPSGHTEMRDCHLMHCWRVTHFYVFLTRRRAHVFVSWSGSLITSRLSTACCRMLGSQVTNKEISPDPVFLEPYDCNKETTHSDTLSLFLQLQSWLCVGMFCKRTIFCVSYMRMHILMSLIIVTMKVWAVTVTFPQLVHINNCDLLLVHWPHNFHTHFSSHLSRQFL